MDIRGLKRTATELLDTHAAGLRRLIGIHSGVSLGFGLIMTLLQETLTHLASSAGGGLDTLGQQAIFSTAQTLLQFVEFALIPFWTAGLLFISLSYTKNCPQSPSSLLEGFRRFKPLLGYALPVGLLYMGAAIAAGYLSGIFLFLTPYGTILYKAAQQLMHDPAADLFTLLGSSRIPVMVCYMAIFAACFCLCGFPVHYRYRLAPYAIMDEETPSGLKALFISHTAMGGKLLQLLRLDISFWWFYLLELTTGLLPLCGVLLDSVAFQWGLLLVASAAQLALHIWAKPKVELTYALAYDALRHAPPPPPKAEKHPWRDFGC